MSSNSPSNIQKAKYGIGHRLDKRAWASPAFSQTPCTYTVHVQLPEIWILHLHYPWPLPVKPKDGQRPNQVLTVLSKPNTITKHYCISPAPPPLPSTVHPSVKAPPSCWVQRKHAPCMNRFIVAMSTFRTIYRGRVQAGNWSLYETVSGWRCVPEYAIRKPLTP
jgi:hypothetical protein